ncbi:uncharacterized protein LOC112494591 [Cephus cinctus]|uniref:Uncharacterized protein LOC112494591 n=1 Tax=Cephus cinctus TaxID=211228 RepID=A0AAJ7RK64_CEPCN|nr:uncharacterized protein LOC112494591 [Cephus cinctus]
MPHGDKSPDGPQRPSPGNVCAVARVSVPLRRGSASTPKRSPLKNCHIGIVVLVIVALKDTSCALGALLVDVLRKYFTSKRMLTSKLEVSAAAAASIKRKQNRLGSMWLFNLLSVTIY